MGDVRYSSFDGGDHLWYASRKFSSKSLHVRISSVYEHVRDFDDIRADDDTTAGYHNGHNQLKFRHMEFVHRSNQNRGSLRFRLYGRHHLWACSLERGLGGPAGRAHRGFHVSYQCNKRQGMLLQRRGVNVCNSSFECGDSRGPYNTSDIESFDIIGE